MAELGGFMGEGLANEDGIEMKRKSFAYNIGDNIKQFAQRAKGKTVELANNARGFATDKIDTVKEAASNIRDGRLANLDRLLGINDKSDRGLDR